MLEKNLTKPLKHFKCRTHSVCGKAKHYKYRTPKKVDGKDHFPTHSTLCRLRSHICHSAISRLSTTGQQENLLEGKEDIMEETSIYYILCIAHFSILVALTFNAICLLRYHVVKTDVTTMCRWYSHQHGTLQFNLSF